MKTRKNYRFNKFTNVVHCDLIFAVYQLKQCRTTLNADSVRMIRSNYITYIQKITGHQPSELIKLAQNRED